MMMFTETRGTRKAFAKDPAVVQYKNKYYLYYSSYFDDAKEEKLGIGIAISEDGENWEQVAIFPLTQECERNGVGAPGAIVLNGKVHLFYQTYGNWETDAICHAVSEDGINFVKDETNPIFRPTNDWCVGRAIDADVVPFCGKLFLYFATRDHEMKIQKIGVAYADIESDFSRKCWNQAATRSILEPQYLWEGECIEAPATVVKNDCVYMFYGGAYNCAPQQIGVAVSKDGITFTKCFDKPFLACGKEGEWNSDESGHPYAYVDESGRCWLYYQGTNDMGESWYISRKEIEFKNGIPALKE